MNAPLSINEQIFRTASACLKSGDPMPSDDQLAIRFGTSRPTVANAIYRLRCRGLLKTDGRHVISVTPTRTRAARSKTPGPSSFAKANLLALVKYCDWEGVRWPPRKNIAAALNISVTAVDATMTALAEEGLVYRAAPGVYRIGDCA